MSVIRAFIAIELTDEIHQRLDEVIARYKKQMPQVPIRWVPAKNIHLTLKFLGDVSVANLEMLTSQLQKEVAAHPPFEVSVGGSGAFPNPCRGAGDLGGGGGASRTGSRAERHRERHGALGLCPGRAPVFPAPHPGQGLAQRHCPRPAHDRPGSGNHQSQFPGGGAGAAGDIYSAVTCSLRARSTHVSLLRRSANRRSPIINKNDEVSSGNA